MIKQKLYISQVAVKLKKDILLKVAGKSLKSRLIVGTGKYKSFLETAKAVQASGADMVTVAVRRVNILDKKKSPHALLTAVEPNMFRKNFFYATNRTVFLQVQAIQIFEKILAIKIFISMQCRKIHRNLNHLSLAKKWKSPDLGIMYLSFMRKIIIFLKFCS